MRMWGSSRTGGALKEGENKRRRRGGRGKESVQRKEGQKECMGISKDPSKTPKNTKKRTEIQVISNSWEGGPHLTVGEFGKKKKRTAGSNRGTRRCTSGVDTPSQRGRQNSAIGRKVNE